VRFGGCSSKRADNVVAYFRAQGVNPNILSAKGFGDTRPAASFAGPGGGLEKISASGPVYKLANVSDFPGRYTQSIGKAGLCSSGSSDLWLENNAGVVMHLQGTSTGAVLTLGKDEIIIRMAQ
jgi:hypothetical protein